MAYKKGRNLHKKRVRSKRTIVASFMLLFLAIIVSGIIFVDRILSETESSRFVDTGVQAKVESSTINIFRTPYFQFQAPRDWREITEETNESRFVYRGFKENLVEHQLIVEVDNDRTQFPVDIADEITRAYPFKEENNRIVPTAGISDHCGDLEEGLPNKLIRMTYENTEFDCVVDGSSYVVSLTEDRGNEVFTHVGQDGVERTFRVTYQNSAFTPSGAILRSIVKTFLLL